ncbi:MAG: hypothetical protein QNL04_10180 [SAR324 cluster bacterium]|nr:hypothetical protein [SAR324 cluster bacterium]
MKKLLLSLMLFGLISNAQANEFFTPKEHCIGYKATKSMFFMNVDILAKGCDPKIILEESPDKSKFRVRVEHEFLKVDSGMQKRDEHMAEILEIPARGMIAFQSEWLSRNWLLKAKQKENITISGQIIGGKIKQDALFQLSLTQSEAGWIMAGKALASLDSYRLSIPTIGPFGIIADVHQDFELLVHLLLENNQDLASLLQ